MNEDQLDMYYEAFSGLAEPFPKLLELEAYDTTSLPEGMIKEMLRLQRKEQEYIARKAELKLEYIKKYGIPEFNRSDKDVD